MKFTKKLEARVELVFYFLFLTRLLIYLFFDFFYLLLDGA